MFRMRTEDGKYFEGEEGLDNLLLTIETPAICTEANGRGFFVYLLPEGWKVTPKERNFTLWRDSDSRYVTYIVADRRGEIRDIRENILWEILKFQSFSAYDKAKEERKITEKISYLENEVESLRNSLGFARKDEALEKDRVDQALSLLREIGGLNEKAGPGSRKAVRDLLYSQNIHPCENCGHFVCECPEEE